MIELYNSLVILSIVISFLALCTAIAGAVIALGVKNSTHRAHLIPVEQKVKELETQSPEGQMDAKAAAEVEKLFGSSFDAFDPIT